MKFYLPIILLLIFLNLPVYIFARTTPADILNSKIENYNLKIKSFSSTNQQKIENLKMELASINKKRTDELHQNMVMQGLILDEFVRRNNYQEDGGKDGINRNLNKEVENVRYWITYAHEAVSFQAAKVYIPNLSSESNLKSDALNEISRLESELNSTKLKVIKSQKLLLDLVKAK